MGVDATDFDQDGKQDLFVANVDQEMFSLYHNDGHEFFSDVAATNGVAQATRLLSGWGLKFFDYDNDGHLDLFLANGHPDDMIGEYSQMVKYKEPLLLFHNNGTKLENVSASAGPVFAKSFPARGLTIGDYNNDGKIDVFVGNNGEAPVLLKNNTGDGNHWVGLKLQGTDCNRDAVGARLTWSVNGTVRRKLPQRGRQLPLGTRSARRDRSRHSHEARLPGDRVAATESAEGALREPAHRPVRHDCGGTGEDRNVMKNAN